MKDDVKKIKRKLIPKYLLDKIISLVLIALTSPLMLLAILLITVGNVFCKKDRGPILYRERRITEDRPFFILKFRTVPMEKIRWVQESPFDRSVSGSTELTWAGRVILNWYLDELPQLFNILKGDMSLVGPRPHIEKMYKNSIGTGQDDYKSYLRAGLLGIPQACKRSPKYHAHLISMVKNDRKVPEAVRHLDRYYAKVCRDGNIFKILSLDFYIIYRCLLVVFKGGGSS